MRHITDEAYSGDIAVRLRNWRGLHFAHYGGANEPESAVTLRALLERLR